MKLRQIAATLALAAACASSHAGVIYDSANGQAPMTSGTTAANAITGYLTSVVVTSAVTINQIEQLSYAYTNAQYQWVIYSASGSLLFASGVKNELANTGAATFANATYKASPLFNYTLAAGTYRIGAVTNGNAIYFAENTQNNAGGLIRDGIANYNASGFNNPAANPDGGYCCDLYIRLRTADAVLPEPGSTSLLLAAIPAILGMRRRRKAL